MNQKQIEDNEEIITRIMQALACNNINMATALIETDRMTPGQILALDEYLWQHDGEITEEEFMTFINKAYVVKTPPYWKEEKYQPLIEVKTVYKNKVKIPSVMKDNWDFLMQCCENIIQREGRQRGLEIIKR